MSNYSDIKRKHFRFPAYNDDEGVKIPRENKRNLFSRGDDWLINKNADGAQSKANYVPPRHSVFDDNTNQERAIRRSRKATNEKQGHTLQQQEELKKHRQNLPDYTKRVIPEPNLAGKTDLFGREQIRSTYKVQSKQQKQTDAASLKRQYSGRSYFVPKYIPASVIPEEKKTDISQSELAASMKKDQDSYLTFDMEPAAYQEKKVDDPSVRKFNHTEAGSVSMTRSQYRKAAPEEKKRQVLDRSLQGLIEEEQKEFDDPNGYFTHE